MVNSVKTAVIGAGVAGMVVARELRREGHKVTVFEKASKIGGTWVYDPRVESDPISIDPNREIVHSSLYLSLRTNLPRDLMGFSDYPFLVKENGDPRNYPGHHEFLSFLNDFARDFNITELVRFNSEVIAVERIESNDGGWSVEFRGGDDKLGSSETKTEIFEAVLICNGHQTVPILAHPLGIENWKGKQIHSHNYRIPQPFLDQIVVMIGDGPSGMDISKEIATVAKEVHLSSRSPDSKISKLEGYDNMWQHSEIKCVGNTIITFNNGSSVHPDIIFHCTGYKFDFPFLHTNGIVLVDDNCIGPLYKHVFVPEFGPFLSFLAIPTRVILTLMVELQAKWIAKLLSREIVLPTKDEMMKDVTEYYKELEENGSPKHLTHRLSLKTIEYMDWIANEIGAPPIEEKLKKMFCNLMNSYRDIDK